MRPHLALAVTHAERAYPFHDALLATAPAKQRPGCAEFPAAEPASSCCGEVEECCAA